MIIRMFAACILAFTACCSGATAQQAGSTSGPAAGTNTEPSTAIQKQSEGRSVGGELNYRRSSEAAGAPGVEGKPGTESGPAVQRPMNPNEGK